MDRLLQVPLFPDEILPSFLTRFARANGQTTSEGFCRDLGLSHKGILEGDPATIVKLATITRANGCDLLRQTVIFSKKDGVLLFGEQFSNAQIAKSAIRVCHSCLAEDAIATDRMPGTRLYRRAQWLVRDYRVCEKHSCFVVDAGRQARGRDFFDCLEYSGVHRYHAYKSLVSDPTCIERFVNERLAGKRCHGDILDLVPVGVALDASRILGNALKRGMEALSDAVESRDSVARSDFGLVTLMAGKAGLSGALDRLMELPYRTQHGTARYWGVSSQLLKRCEKVGPNPISSLVAKHNDAATTEGNDQLRQSATGRISATKAQRQADVTRLLLRQA